MSISSRDVVMASGDQAQSERVYPHKVAMIDFNKWETNSIINNYRLRTRTNKYVTSPEAGSDGKVWT